MTALVLGPVLRYIDSETASIWVQTATAADVTVRVGEREWAAATFAVHGHHYALVDVVGLVPGERQSYSVAVNGVPVWPTGEQPPSTLATPVPDALPTIAFGSCRTSVPHDAHGHLTHGVDALRTFGMAKARGDATVPDWPDLMLLLGDQVYADELSQEMVDFIATRRPLDEPPGKELKDYQEYAQLYKIAWGEPWIRWLFSCLPTLMIFDDHDVRDDWNTSWQWRQEMESTSWWQGRIVAALASYWVYQHIGNLSPAEREEDEIWSVLLTRRAEQDGEVDLTDVLDAFARRVDRFPATYRWSYVREYDGARVVVIDSRAARVVEERDRSMLDDEEMAWLDQQMRGDCTHLLIGTSLPFLLPNGLHFLESWDEAVGKGVWGPRMAGMAEHLRKGMDLEHWAAFQDAFVRVAAMVEQVAMGRRGAAPAAITFLSGDVHHSYIAEVTPANGARILQFVCSPIRNPLPRPVRAANVLASHRLAALVGQPLARRAKVPDPPFTWETASGPWYDNNFAILALDAERMRVTWWTGEVEDGDHREPKLDRVAQVDLDVPGGTRSWRRKRPRRPPPLSASWFPSRHEPHDGNRTK